MSEVSRERRAATRVPADIPLRLAPDAGASPAQLQNISTTGLCCMAHEALNEMTQVAIHLELPGLPEPCAVSGVVVRCERDREEAPGYEVAVYFTDMAAETRKAIQAYVLSRIEA